MKIKHAVLATALLFATVARADTFTQVTASASWSGAPFAEGGTGLGAVETFSASFLWDVTTTSAVPGSATWSSSGPVGPFTGFNSSGCCASFSGANASVFIDTTNETFLFGPTFSRIGTYSYDCIFPLCAGNDGFYLSYPTAPNFGEQGDATLVVTAPVQTPEPEIWMLTLAAISLILGFVPRKERGDR